MNKLLATVILIVVLFLALSSFLYYYFFNSKKTPKINLVKTTNLNLLLDDMGWYQHETITLLNGDSLKRDSVKNITVEYSLQPGQTLRQGNKNGEVFASIDSEFKNNTLKFLVYVSPDKITESVDKNWWIDHQVIRALNKMIYSSESDDQLIERDRVIYLLRL